MLKQNLTNPVIKSLQVVNPWSDEEAVHFSFQFDIKAKMVVALVGLWAGSSNEGVREFLARFMALATKLFM
jgi:hypothetical protein